MEKVSAWMDGELERAECAKLVRQCGADQHASWNAYHLIGEALRGELDAKSCSIGNDAALQSKIFAALEAEPNVLVPAVARAANARASAALDEVATPATGGYVKVGNGAAIWRPWLIAASVATAAVVGWQAVTSDWRRGDAALVAKSVPAAPVPMPPVSAAVSYDNYIRAHAEVAPVTRLSGARVYGQPVSYGPTH